MVFGAFRNWKSTDDDDAKMKETFEQCAKAILNIYKSAQDQLNNFNNYIGRDQNVRSIIKKFPSKILLSGDVIKLSYKLQILVEMEKKYLMAFPNNISKLEKFECPRNMNDGDLKKLVPHFLRLKCLRFYKCKHITSHGIDYLSKNWPEGSLGLRELILYDCDKVNDEAVTNLVRSCPKLKTLFLSGSLLTAASLELLGENCENLRKLVLGISGNLRGKHIRKIENVTDDGILSIARGCKQLRHLNLNHCTNVTDEALNHLADCAKNLTRIDIFGCAQVTIEGLKTIRSNFPELKKITFDDPTIKKWKSHLIKGVKQLARTNSKRNYPELIRVPQDCY